MVEALVANHGRGQHGNDHAFCGDVRNVAKGRPGRLPMLTSGRGCAALRPWPRTIAGAWSSGSSSWVPIVANRVGQRAKFRNGINAPVSGGWTA